MNEAGPEPDYRMSLAAERTYLAYIRTALALLAAGVAVEGALPHAGHQPLRRTAGVVLVVAGLYAAVTAGARLAKVNRAMRRAEPLPSSRAPVVLTVGVCTAGGLALALVILT